jgi:serine/threonine-protein kinase SRPK3
MSSTQVRSFISLPTVPSKTYNIELTDIQPLNILMGVPDDSAFARFEREELQDPLPREESSSHMVYLSRPVSFTTGAPLLCDLSEARFESPENDDLIMPDVYRAPEALLGMPEKDGVAKGVVFVLSRPAAVEYKGCSTNAKKGKCSGVTITKPRTVFLNPTPTMPWSYPVDVWGFAMTVRTFHAASTFDPRLTLNSGQVWDLFQPKRLFSPHNGDGIYSERHHLARMVAVMGPPPLDFLQRSEKSKKYWDEEGSATRYSQGCKF